MPIETVPAKEDLVMPRSAKAAFSFHALVFASLLVPATVSLAQTAADYPSKPIRMIVPFSAGGATDVMARLIGQRLTESWGQQIIVENRIGAGGNIGMEAVSKASADGYTIVLMNNAAATNAAMSARLPFDVTRDFAAVGLVASTPMMLIANPTVKAANLRELTAYLRANPGKLSYASCGLGGPQHFATELYKSQAGVFIVHAPYRGCAQAVADVVGGQIELAMVSANVAIPHIKTGKIKAIALSAKVRTPAAPETPTFRESGIPGLNDYAVDVWYGVMAPAGTPRDIVAKLGVEVRRILDQPEMKQKMAAAGIDPLNGDGNELMSLLRADIETFRKVVKFAGIKLE
jgi:tripartite-type tricarboxylate transporter receptor subunit TctC